MSLRNGITCFEDPIKTLVMTEESDLHLEDIDHSVRFRFVVGLDDLSTCALYSAKYLEHLLHKSGHFVDMDLQCGGHLMEPPTFPHHAFCWNKMAGKQGTLSNYLCKNYFWERMC